MGGEEGVTEGGRRGESRDEMLPSTASEGVIDACTWSLIPVRASKSLNYTRLSEVEKVQRGTLTKRGKEEAAKRVLADCLCVQMRE